MSESSETKCDKCVEQRKKGYNKCYTCNYPSKCSQCGKPAKKELELCYNCANPARCTQCGKRTKKGPRALL